MIYPCIVCSNLDNDNCICEKYKRWFRHEWGEACGRIKKAAPTAATASTAKNGYKGIIPGKDENVKTDHK